MHLPLLSSLLASFLAVAGERPAGDVPAGLRALRFEPNRGQADAAFDFVARLPGGGVGLRGDRAVLGRADRSVTLVFESAIAGVAGVGEQPARARLHYFRGSDPSRWQRDVPTFERVRYAGVWRGIDVVWHEREGDLEYDFELAPGARVDDVVLRADGASRADVNERGELVLETPHGAIAQSPPLCTERLPDGSFVTLAARWRVLDATPGSSSPRLAFDVPDHDPTRPLVIDPVVTVFVLLGGSSGNETIRGALVDASGNLFVCGETNSSNFPVAGGGSDTTLTGDYDLFVAVFDENGSTLIASAFFGGSRAEYPARIAETAGGHYLVCGGTTSADLPTPTAPGSPPPFQENLIGTQDGFVAEFDADLDLVAGTYFGGSNSDGANDVAATPTGGCVIAGFTWSPDLVVVNADQPLHGGETDGFVAMLDDGLSTLAWSTFRGGNGNESLRALVADPDGSYLAAGTGPDSSGNVGALITRYDASGALLDSSAFADAGSFQGIAVAADGAVAAAGSVTVASFPASNGFGGIIDGFVLVLAADLDTIEFAAFLGGSGQDYAYDVATQGDDVWVSGAGDSEDVTLVARIAPPPLLGSGGLDTRAFAARVNRSSGPAVLDFFSCLPIGDSSHGDAIAADIPGGPVWVFGRASSSTNFNPLDVLPPTMRFGGDTRSQSFAMRVDPAPLGGVELIGFGLTTVAINPTAQPTHIARVYRRNDASSYAMLPWTLTDASNGVPLRSGAIVFAPGDQLVEFSFATGGLPAVCNLTLTESDSESPGLLDDRADSQELDPSATTQQLLVTQPAAPPPVYTGTNDDDDCCIGRVLLERNGNDINPLRRFRDRVLSRFELGRAFTRWYYEQSPRWLAFLREHPALVPFVRFALRLVVAIVAHPLLFVLLLVAARWSPRLCLAWLRRRRRLRALA